MNENDPLVQAMHENWLQLKEGMKNAAEIKDVPLPKGLSVYRNIDMEGHAKSANEKAIQAHLDQEEKAQENAAMQNALPTERESLAYIAASLRHMVKILQHVYGMNPPKPKPKPATPLGHIRFRDKNGNVQELSIDSFFKLMGDPQ